MTATGSTGRFLQGALFTALMATFGLYSTSIARDANRNENSIDAMGKRLDTHEITETVGMAGRISALEEKLREPRYSRGDADRDRAIRLDAERDIREDLHREIVELKRRIERLESRHQLTSGGDGLVVDMHEEP